MPEFCKTVLATMELQWNPIVSIFLARKRTYFVETPVTLNELGALRERL